MITSIFKKGVKVIYLSFKKGVLKRIDFVKFHQTAKNNRY